MKNRKTMYTENFTFVRSKLKTAGGPNTLKNIAVTHSPRAHTKMEFMKLS